MGKKHLWLSMIMLMFFVGLTIVPVPVMSLDGDVAFDLTYYYPGGYVPGVPLGGFVVVDVYVDASALPDLSPEGMVGWGLYVSVDSSVLTPVGAYGGDAGYFLYDWSLINYPPPLPGLPMPYPPQLLQSVGADYIECAEFFMPAPPYGAGNSTGKLCTLYFESLSETAYSPIIIEPYPSSGYQDTTGEKYAINAVNGHYNQPSVYTLTVGSTPIGGIDFTIDSTTYATNRSVSLPQGPYTVTMPFSWMVGTDRYVFSHWEDNSTNPLRTINLTSNMTIMATYELAKEYTLTVNSEPIMGINFTVDGTTYITNWSSLLLEGFHTVAMPLTWTAGTDRYHFVKWEDNSTNPVRVVSLTSNVTITATYVPVYTLTVESTPIDGIDFTIDSVGYTTNATVELQEDSYIVTMPSTWMIGPEQYNFVEWEDASTNPSRVVSLTSNMTIVSTYALAPAAVALISDHSELMTITYIMDSMGLGYHVYNYNSINFYTENASLLLEYQVVIFYTDYRHITSNEYSALESYLSSGGNLLVTGFDCLVGDSLLADLVRSSSYGDNVGEPDLYVVDATHPIMNGPYGSFPAGYHVSGLHGDCDAAEADTAQNAVTVAELADGYDKTIATDELPGKVVFWNGVGHDDWRWNADCETMLKNMLAWFTIQYEHELIVSVEAPDFLEPGQPCMLNATVRNRGLNNETNVDLFLLIDGSAVSNATIPELLTEESYTINYWWTPTVEATYNVTAYVPPVLDENVTANNIASKMVNVRSARYVLFDQTHGTDSIINYSVWVANLTGRDYIVDTLTTSPITPSMLEGYNVFVILQAHDYYSSDELSAIQDFVLNGGGLLVIGDDAPSIYTDLADFAGVSWTSGGTGGITTDITPHEVTLGVASVYLPHPIAVIYVAGAAQDLVRDPAGNVMLAVSEQVGRVVGFTDESFMDFDIDQEDNLRLANNMIEWLMGVKYEHELVVRLDAPNFLEPGDSSLLNATVYNRGLSNETGVELQLLINGIEVESVVIPELLSGSYFTLSHIWTPTVEGIYNLTVYAPPVPGENITANNMMSMLVNVQSLEVALFQNVDPWGYQANEEVLSLYGIAYTVFSSSDFGLVDLSSFSKVVIASDQNQAFYDAMDTYRWWFEDYASNGGVLEIHAADWGWNGGQWVGTLPGGLGWMHYSSDYVTIVDHIHPVVIIPNPITDAELDGWSASVHGYFSIYPADSRIVIIEDSTGSPAYLEFDYGSGFIVASYQTLEWAYSHGYSLILENSLLYSPIKYQHELVVTLETPTFLEPGEPTILNATVYNRGLSNETGVELQLLINGIEVESVVIPELLNGSSYTLTYLWTPIVEATYNVTAYAPPVPDENITTNNVYSAFVTVRFAPRILAYVQYTDYLQEYMNSLAAIDSTFGPAYVLTELWSYTQLDSMLPGHDVLFIPEQEYSHLSMMETIGEAWSDTLSDFLEEGGVIIVCDYSGGSHGILTGAGLMSISSVNYITGQTVYLADPTDALASGVSSSFTAPNGALSFVTDETNVVFDDGTYPVVIHKKVGQGHIALIGFDYYASNPDTEQILGNAVSLALYVRISISPSAGSPGTEVTVTGIKAAANGDVEIYWDDIFIGDVTADPFGNFMYLLTVPLDATAGLHEIRAVDVASGETGLRMFRVIFITMDPASGPIGTKVTVNGAGFSACSQVPITFDDMQIGYALTDDFGNFVFVFNIPLSEAGLHAVKAWQDLNLVETSFTVVDVTPLEIQMDVGSLFFKGETAEFYVQTCFEGVPVDATFMNVTLCKPDGTVETLVAQRIATGLCKIECLIKGKGSMVGTYMLVIEADYVTSTVHSTGTCIRSFLVKEPYTTLEKEAPRAALVAGSIGTILALAVAWRKRKQPKE